MKVKGFFLRALLTLALFVPLVTQVSLVQAQDTVVTVGTGTSTSYYAPFNNYYKNSTNEVIYPASMIRTAGAINAIAYQCATAASFTCTDLKIYLGTTSNLTVQGTSDWYRDVSLVYSHSNVTIGTNSGWQTFTLDQPFYYDSNEGNLVVVVCKTATSCSSTLKYYYTSVSNSMMYRQSDSSPTYADINSTQTGTRSSYRPNIQLTIDPNAPAPCGKVAALTAGNISYNQATVSWTPNGPATSWQVSINGGAWQTVTTPSKTFTNLTQNTTYSVDVKSVCSASDISGAKTVTFTTLPLDIINVTRSIAHTSVILGWEPTVASVYNKAALKYKKNSETTWHWANVANGATSCIIDALEPGTAYDLQMAGIFNNDTMAWHAFSFTTNALGIVEVSAVTTGRVYSASYATPVNNLYNYTLSEMLYTADELGGAQTFTGINFEYVGASAATAKTNCTIYVANTNLATITTSNLVDPATLTPVYVGPINGTPGWNHYEFNHPFNYTGGNLLVVVDDQSGHYNAISYTWGTHSASGYVVTKYADNYGYPDLMTSGSSNTTNRVNTRFNSPVPQFPCLGPNAVVTDVTATTATIEWAPGYSEASWTILKKTADETAFTTVGPTAAHNYTVSGLLPATDYTIRIQSNCSATESAFTDVHFTTECLPSALPYSQNFDSYTTEATIAAAPASYPNHKLPTCWEFLNMSASSSTYPQAFITGYSSYAVTGNCLFFKSSMDAPLYAILPEFTTPSNQAAVEFSYRNEGVSDYNGTIALGYMTDPTDENTFVAVETYPQITTVTNAVCDFVYATAMPANARIAFRYQGGTSSNYYASIDNVVVTVPTCHSIRNLTASTTGTNVALAWQSVSANHDIAYGPAGFDVENDGTVISNVAGTTYTLPLNPAMTYDIYVRANCGTEQSPWQKVSVTTICDSLVLPYTTNFDNQASGSANHGLCWSNLSVGGSYTYYPYITSNATYAHSGTMCLYFYKYNSTSYPDVEIAIAPAVKVSQFPMNNNVVDFWVRQSSATVEDTIYVGIMTDNTNDSTFELVQAIPTSNVAEHHTVYLDTYTGNGAFVAFKALKRATSNNLYLDDVTIASMGNCHPVTDLFADSITSEGCRLGWNDHNGTTNAWQVSYGTTATADDTTFVVTSNPTHITTLEQRTGYYFKVRTACDVANNVYGEWSNVLGINTLSVRTPYHTTFDTTCAYNGNYTWNIAGSTNGNPWYLTVNIPLDTNLTHDTLMIVQQNIPDSIDQTGDYEIIRLYVAVRTTSHENDVMCEGSNATYNEAIFMGEVASATPYVYPNHFLNAKGCDSINYIHMLVNPVYNDNDILNICESALPVVYGANDHNDGDTIPAGIADGTYPITLHTINGCDSVINLAIHVIPTVHQQVNVTTSFPYTWNLSGRTYDVAGTDIDNRYIVGGGIEDCDIVYHLNLDIVPAIERTVCHEYTDWVTGQVHTETGYVVEHLTNINGDDSLVYTHMNVIPRVYTHQYVTTNEPSYTWTAGNGNTYTATSEGAFFRYNQAGTTCDSVLFLHLHMIDTLTLCQNTLPYNSNAYAPAGDLYRPVVNIAAGTVPGDHQYINVDGGSTLIFNYVVLDTFETATALTICSSALPYVFANAIENGTLTAAGTYAVKYVGSNGCDSVDHFTLNVNPAYVIADGTATQIFDTICPGDSYLYLYNPNFAWTAAETMNAGGTTLTMNDTIALPTGCDSMIVMNLYVKQNTVANITETACVSYTFTNPATNVDTVFVNNTNAPVVATATFHTLNAAGCDSTINLTVTLNPATHGNDTLRSSTGSFVFNHVLYEAISATQPLEITVFDTISTVNQYGCDSIIDVALFVGNPVVISENIAACGMYTWRDGETYRQLIPTDAQYPNDSLYMRISDNAIFNIFGRAYRPVHFVEQTSTTYDSIYYLNLVLTQAAVVWDTVTVPYSAHTYTHGNITLAVDSARLENYSIDTMAAFGGVIPVNEYCDSIAFLHLNWVYNYVLHTDTICAVDTTYDWTINGNVHHYNTAAGAYSDELHVYNFYDTVANGLTLGGTALPMIHQMKLTQYKYIYGTDTVVSCFVTDGPYAWQHARDNGFMMDTVFSWSTTNPVYPAGNSHMIHNNMGVFCDSVNTLHLIMNRPDTIDIDTAACVSFVWDLTGATITTSGTYLDHVPADCDDTVYRLNLTIYQPETESFVATACDSYTWDKDANTYNTTGVYTKVVPSVSTHGCDSIYTLNLDVRYTKRDTVDAWNGPGLVFDYTWAENGVTYTTSGVYSDTIARTYAQGCDSINSINLVITLPVDVQDTAWLCDLNTTYHWDLTDDDYTVAANTENIAQVYSNFNAHGVPQELHHLNIFFAGFTTYGLFQAAEDYYCGSYTWMFEQPTNAAMTQSTTVEVGTYTTNSNAYSYHFINPATHCDSVVYLNVNIVPAYNLVDTITICDNALPYTYQGTVQFDQAGTLNETLTTGVYNCDSITSVTLIVNNRSHEVVNDSVCLLADYVNYGFNTPATRYLTSGYYEGIDTLIATNVFGCDSIVLLNLQANAPSTKMITITSCQPYTWVVAGQVVGTFATDTVVTHIIPGANIHGCDSILTLNFTHGTNNVIVNNVQGCGSYTLGGVTYTSDAVVYDTVYNATSCFTVTETHITINQPTYGVQMVNECDSYTWIDGQTYVANTTPATAPTYTLVGANANGCDSIITLNLNIRHSTSSHIYGVESCYNYIWTDFGTAYTESGVYAQHTTNAEGCDSTVFLHLTINPRVYTNTVEQACDSYTWNGLTYTVSGSYTQTFTSNAGCDSIVTVALTVLNSTTNTVNAEGCDSYTWNGQTYTNSGVYTATFSNSLGCDSVVTLVLNVKHPVHIATTFKACDSYTWADGTGLTYTQSGIYTNYGTAANGCDSVVTLNLTIEHSTSSVDVETACDSYTWMNGQTYTANNNTATFTRLNHVGCDSVITLNLTINHSVSNNISESACESYTWNGTTYTVSTSTVWHGTTAEGCDSVVTMNLTINHGTTGVESATACDTYTWTNGTNQTYNISGLYIYEYANAYNCASTLTLNLTINNSVQQSFDATACAAYAWDGITYTESGSYINNYQTAQGCDSVVTMNLTINAPTASVETVTACDTYTWINGVTYTASVSNPTFTTTNAAGCDSIITLHLTINYSTESEETVYVTYSTTGYNWHGMNYMGSGDYNYHMTNAVGCDSNLVLHLHVLGEPNVSSDCPTPELVKYRQQVLMVNHYPNGSTDRVDYGYYTWYKVVNNSSLEYIGEGAAMDYLLVNESGEYVVLVRRDACNDEAFSNTIVVDMTNAIDDVALDVNMTVAPNPAISGSQVTVTTNLDEARLQGATLYMYDLQGRVVMKQAMSQASVSFTANQAAGVYTIRLVTKNGESYVKKVIIR